MNKKEEYKKFVDRVMVIRGIQKGIVFLGESGNIHKLFYGDYPNDLVSGEMGEIYYTWHGTGGSEKFFRLKIQPENMDKLYEIFDKYIEELKKVSFRDVKCRYM